MTETQVRQSIPDDWSQKVTCPLCSVFKMHVVHLPASPDQLHCDGCGFSIEVELGGNLIRVMGWPESSRALEPEVADRWISVEEMQKLVRELPTRRHTEAAPESQPPQLDQHILDEMRHQVESLHDLGNTPQQILSVLEENELDPQRIAAGRALIDELEQRYKDDQRRKFRYTAALAAVILTVVIVLGYMLGRFLMEGSNGAISFLQTSALPGIVSALDVKTPVGGYNPTSAGSAPSGINGCPRTPEEAAAMFGGLAAQWSAPSSHGWILVTTKQVGNIYVPETMTASYLQFNNELNLSQVAGPIFLKNIRYVAISCK
jgi:hypothetical protein